MIKPLLNFGVPALIFFGVVSCNAPETTPQQEQTETTDLDTSAIKEKGKAIVQASFQALSGELKAAMQRGGISAAVDYCNVNAYPLTDSLSMHFAATIRRTSHKVRNAANTPDAIEKAVIDGYLNAQEQGKPLVPVVVSEGDRSRYFHPIQLAATCLSCHGQPNKDIQPATLVLIDERYPMDKATGFSEGDFRGVWSIAFNN